ncbi:unnamed protein product [Polarella glacialis]|uniref:EF-hand domain-containing protein n=1 Tax=Polarella glacialis TaxID=89957 RepID=A0A813JWN8_POLGL|nr:unnamed protein product [Polarella glacialis]
MLTAARDIKATDFSFNLRQDLIQRIEEKFSAMRYEAWHLQFASSGSELTISVVVPRSQEEVEYALSAGFAEMQLSEFRGIFDMFDADGSRSLDREAGCRNLCGSV